MLTLLSALGSLLSFRVRSRLTLELGLVALRHQLTVLRRQRPGRPQLFSADAAVDMFVVVTAAPSLGPYSRPLPAPLSPAHRSGVCTISTSVERLEPVWSKYWPGQRTVTPPHDDSSAGAHPIARGIAPAPRGADPCSECRFRRKPATYSDLIAATLPI